MINMNTNINIRVEGGIYLPHQISQQEKPKASLLDWFLRSLIPRLLAHILPGHA